MWFLNSVHRDFCAGRCSAATQLKGGVWTDLNTNAEQPKMANPGRADDNITVTVVYTIRYNLVDLSTRP